METDTLLICKSLVQISSISENEQKIADFIEKTAKAAGLSAVRVENSVVIQPSQKNHDTAVVLYAHIDTVPPGEEKNWKHPPYAALMEDGKLFGLGASDDKGAAACLLSSAIEMKAEGKPTASDVYYLFAEGEEKDGAGAKQFIEWFSAQGLKKKYRKVWCVVGEPTDLSKIETGCRGAFFIRVHVNGKSYHAADFDKKADDALSKALQITQIAKKLEKEGQKSYTHLFLGKPTVSITGIHAGEKANKFPDYAKVTMDVRTTPGFHEKFISKLKIALTEADIMHTLEVSPRQLAPYCLASESELELQIAKFTKAKVCAARGSNDCAFFIAGGMEAVSFGPGVKDCIHQQDEYIPLAHLEKGKKIFSILAEKLSPK